MSGLSGWAEDRDDLFTDASSSSSMEMQEEGEKEGSGESSYTPTDRTEEDGGEDGEYGEGTEKEQQLSNHEASSDSEGSGTD